MQVRQMLAGVVPIVATPFDENAAVDELSLRRLVRYCLDSGVHGLAPTGGASECYKLTREERQRIVGIVVEESAGHVPVMAGTSGVNAGETLELSLQAQRSGANAVFVAPPLWGQMGLDALHGYYRKLAESLEIPIVIHNGGEKAVPNSLIARLVEECPNVRYVKEERQLVTRNVMDLLELTARKLRVLSGGAQPIEELRAGAVGVVPGSVGVPLQVAIYTKLQIGDLASAREIYSRLLPVRTWMAQFGDVGVKEVLVQLGVFRTACTREPSGATLKPFERRTLAEILEWAGLSHYG